MVLIEAFVILCLLFMLQYIVSGISSGTSDPVTVAQFYAIDFRQLQTANDTTNHVDYIQVGSLMLDMGASRDKGSNCPVSADPKSYHYMDGTRTSWDLGPPDRVTVASGEKANSFLISDDAAYEDVKQALALQKVIISRKKGAEVGFDISIAGYLTDLKEPLRIAIYTCACGLQNKGTALGLRFPHPSTISVVTFSAKGAVSKTLVAYNHFEMAAERGKAHGWLTIDSDGAIPDHPLREFQLLVRRDGSIETTNLEELVSGGLAKVQ